MSSVVRAPSNTKIGNDFFVNVASIATGAGGDLYAYNESTGAVSAVDLSATFSATPYAAGTFFVRDLGKTVTVNSTSYRKVQAFTLLGAENAAYTFYIKLVPATGLACEWARLTLQA